MKKIFAIVLTAVLAVSCAVTSFGAIEIQRNVEPETDIIGFDVNYIPSAPVMDGKISEGEYYKVNFGDVDDYFSYMIGANLFEVTTTFEDMKKFLEEEVEVYTAWHGNYFYLAVRSHAGKAEYNCSLTGDEVYMFRAWCLQMAITDMEAVGTDRAEIGVGYDPNGGMLSYTKWGDRKNIDLTAEQDFGTNWDKDAEKVTYELRVNLGTVLGEKPENDATFRMGFCLCMGDGDKTTDDMQKQIEYGFGIACEKIVKNLPILTLAGKPAGVEDGDDVTTAPEDDVPAEEEQEGFSAADRFDKAGAAAIFDKTNGSVEAKDMDENGEKFVRLTVTGKDPIIGSSDLTQGLNMDDKGLYVAVKYRTSSQKSNLLAINYTNSLRPTLDRVNDYDPGYGMGNDGQWHTIVFDMSSEANWSQFITEFYLAPFNDTTEDVTGEYVDIQWIKYYSAAPIFEDEVFPDFIGDKNEPKPVQTEAPADEPSETDAETDVATKAPATSADNKDDNKDDNKGGVPVWLIAVIAAAVVAVVAVVVVVIKKKKA